MPNIQNDEAQELSKNYKGGPCSHPELYKEYYKSSATGDYVCSRCGEAFWGPTYTAASENAAANPRKK